MVLCRHSTEQPRILLIELYRIEIEPGTAGFFTDTAFNRTL